MGTRIIIQLIAFVALLPALGGCSGEKQDNVPQNREIVLSMSGPATFSPKSRAPVDGWNNTQVSIGYAFAPDNIFDRSLTVSVTDNNGKLVNTGIAYPENDSDVWFIGYHPAAATSALGTVTYDLSKGNVDVMVSNSVSGSLHNTIMDQGEKLVFEHMLTRVTFKLQCVNGHTYPEPIYGLRASASGPKLLNTAVTFDLAVENLTFKVSGGVFAGNLEGFTIPQYGNPPVIVEMMLQPDVPLFFVVQSLTGERNISINSDPGGFWAELTTNGGGRGKQYTVELSFSGEMILAQNVTVTPWESGSNLGGGQLTWW